MNLATVALRNVARNRFRMVLTVLGVAVALLAFILLQTVITAWNVGVDAAAKDRIGTRHKVSFVMSMPKRYVDVLRDHDRFPEIRQVTWANWFGAKDPRHPDDFFATIAVDPASYLEVYDEVQVPPAQAQAWIEDRQGALIGDVLARKLHVQPGDRITLEGSIFPGDWTFNVRGIYTATRRSVDRSTFLLHWDYMNQSLPEERRDQIGWIVSRVDDPRHAAAVSRAIDRRFEDEDTQTLSMSEKAMNNSFMAMFSGILTAMNIVSRIILLILLLILGNTVAMGVRERTNEYGVLRALGFLPRHVVMFIVGESIFTGAIAGGVGLAIAYPLVTFGMGRWLEENMGGWFPYFQIAPETGIAAFVFAVILGAAAALIPAYRASRLTIVDALRRID